MNYFINKTDQFIDTTNNRYRVLTPHKNQSINDKLFGFRDQNGKVCLYGAIFFKENYHLGKIRKVKKNQ